VAFVFNEIDQAPLNGVLPGTDVVVSFQVSSDDYVDGMLGFSRSYAINPSSFTLTFDSLRAKTCSMMPAADCSNAVTPCAPLRTVAL